MNSGQHEIRKAICYKSTKEDSLVEGKIYDYYINYDRDCIFVLVPAPKPYDFDYHCGFDKEHFDEHFYDLKEYRLKKLNKIGRSQNMILTEYDGIRRDDWWLKDDFYYKVIEIVVEDDDIEVMVRECNKDKSNRGIRCLIPVKDFKKFYKHERCVKLEKLRDLND